MIFASMLLFCFSLMLAALILFSLILLDGCRLFHSLTLSFSRHTCHYFSHIDYAARYCQSARHTDFSFRHDSFAAPRLRAACCCRAPCATCLSRALRHASDAARKIRAMRRYALFAIYLFALMPFSSFFSILLLDAYAFISALCAPIIAATLMLLPCHVSCGCL